MAIDFRQVQKPGRKLRKLLKKMSAEPSPAQVHDFRTNSRKLEATVQAFGLARDGAVRRALKPLSRLRKRAGKIRDMDVLTGYAATIHAGDGEKDCAVQLLEYLGAQRRKHARKFHSAVLEDTSKLRRRLRKAERDLAKDQKQVEVNGKPLAQPSSSALDLGSDLASVPRLNRSNLHPFRLKVKELRNVLRLAEAPDENLINALGDVKDAIGEWHDWEELVGIAQKVLDHSSQCKLVQQLRSTSHERYDTALSQAEQLRKRYLGISSKKPVRSRSAAPPESVLRAAMKLVA